MKNKKLPSSVFNILYL